MKALLLGGLVACAHPRAGIDWTQPPPIPEPAGFVAPIPAQVALDDGVRILLVENHRLPLVAIGAVSLGAGSREDGDQHGLAAVTADALVEGFAPELADLGARVVADISTDAATLELQVQPARLLAALAVISEMLAHPRFTNDDVIRVRDERAARLAQRRESSRTLAAQRFDALVFGAHPYAHPAEGDPDTVAAITTGDVRRFHGLHYGPTATTVIAVGDLDAESARVLKSRFAAWHAPIAPAPVAPLPAPPPPAIEIVDRPGATIAVIVAGGRGQPARAPDRIAAELANTALGGAPTSRLDHRFHDELNLALAASSSFWRGSAGGSWAIATTVARADARTAITELRAQLAAARARPFSDAELAIARVQLRRALPRTFETDLGTVHAFERLVIQEQPLDYYRAFSDRLDHVTAEAARTAIAALWTEPIIVVVGDRAALAPALEGL